MKTQTHLEKFSQFKISNPKYIFGGDGPVVDKTKRKLKGNGINEEEESED